MTVGLAFFLGFLFYALVVIGMYTPAIKTHQYYIPGSMLFALAASFLWPWVTQNTESQEELYLRGIIWDAMLIGCYSLIPIFFGVRLTPMAMFGVVLVLVGIATMKLS